MFTPIRLRIVLALLVALISGGVVASGAIIAGDVSWPRCGAIALLNGADPYAACDIAPLATYPLTTVIIALPLTLLPEPATTYGAVFMAFSSGLLAYGLTRDNAYWRLLLFLSFPYWHALVVVQWSPLLCAITLFPALLPLTLAKPHLGLPIALITRWNWWNVGASAVLLLVSFLVIPDWPWRWQSQISTYDGQFPLLTIPGGFLLLLLIPYWRNHGARLLVMLTAVPQRVAYDMLLLFLIPQTYREMIFLVMVSWAGWLAWFGPHGKVQVITIHYVGALVVVIWALVRQRKHTQEQLAEGERQRT